MRTKNQEVKQEFDNKVVVIKTGKKASFDCVCNALDKIKKGKAHLVFACDRMSQDFKAGKENGLVERVQEWKRKILKASEIFQEIEKDSIVEKYFKFLER